MIHTSHRDRKAKAIAEVLAMIDAYPPLAPHWPRPVLETEEWLFESATEFTEPRLALASQAQDLTIARAGRDYDVKCGAIG